MSNLTQYDCNWHFQLGRFTTSSAALLETVTLLSPEALIQADLLVSCPDLPGPDPLHQGTDRLQLLFLVEQVVALPQRVRRRKVSTT